MDFRNESMEAEKERHLKLFESDTTYNRKDAIDLESLIKRPTRKEMQVEKERLLKLFESRVGRESDGKTPLNIALIGTPGVGKSSLINTFIASMSDHYEDYVLSGSFTDGRQITMVSRSLSKEVYETRFNSDLCLPTFIDIAGFDDEETELCEELLRIVFYGCLPDREYLKDAKEYETEYGIEALQNKYCSQRGTKIDRIIFVANSNENLPENLIRRVMNVAMPSGAKGKRHIPIFGVLTKADAFTPGDEALKQREELFLGLLGLKGIKHHYALLSSYCDDVDKDNERTEHALPEIDVPALRLLIQVCGTRLGVLNNDETYTDAPNHSLNSGSSNDLQATREPETCHGGTTSNPFLFKFDPNIFTLLLYYCLIPVVFIYLISAMAPVVGVTEFNSPCAKFRTDLVAGNIQSDNPEMVNICEKKIEITKPVWLRLMGGFIFIVMIDLGYRFTG